MERQDGGVGPPDALQKGGELLQGMHGAAEDSHLQMRPVPASLEPGSAR